MVGGAPKFSCGYFADRCSPVFISGNGWCVEACGGKDSCDYALCMPEPALSVNASIRFLTADFCAGVSLRSVRKSA